MCKIKSIFSGTYVLKFVDFSMIRTMIEVYIYFFIKKTSEDSICFFFQNSLEKKGIELKIHLFSL